MIRRFCDCCGSEMEREGVKTEAILKVPRDNPTGDVTLIVVHRRPANGSTATLDLCDPCVLGAFRRRYPRAWGDEPGG